VIGAVWRRIWRCYRSGEGRGGPQRGLERVDLRTAGPESASIAGFAVLGGGVLSCPGAMISLARSEAMQLCLDLGGLSAPAAALWELVGSEERRSAIALLAALMAQMVAEGPCGDPASVEDAGAPGRGGDRR